MNNYEEKKYWDLVDLAKERGYDVPVGTTKADVIAMLVEGDKEENQPKDEKPEKEVEPNIIKKDVGKNVSKLMPLDAKLEKEIDNLDDDKVVLEIIHGAQIGYVRVFSEKDHGEDFKEPAKSFARKFKVRIANK